MAKLNTTTTNAVNRSEKSLYAAQVRLTALRTKNSFRHSSKDFNGKIEFAPMFTGGFPQLRVIQDIVPYGLQNKTHKLFDSIKDARKVLLRHKSDLTTTKNVEFDCITALDSSNRLPNLFYKREDQTSIGAYKVRGALYQASKIVKENPNKDLNFFAASTGNHALGVLKSAEILKLSNVTICVPENVANFKLQKLETRISELNKRGLNAKLVVKGETFEETNQLTQELAKQDELSFYIDPYNNHDAVAGQGTIGLELLSQLDRKLAGFKKVEELTVIVPIGGGGLISGVSCALKEGIGDFQNLKKLKLNIVGVKLENLNTQFGDAIKVEHVGHHNNDLISGLVKRQVKINDDDMKKGMDFIFKDLGAKVESASAGTLKPVLDGTIRPTERNAVVCLLSGGNVLA